MDADHAQEMYFRWERAVENVTFIIIIITIIIIIITTIMAIVVQLTSCQSLGIEKAWARESVNTSKSLSKVL